MDLSNSGPVPLRRIQKSGGGPLQVQHTIDSLCLRCYSIPSDRKQSIMAVLDGLAQAIHVPSAPSDKGRFLLYVAASDEPSETMMSLYAHIGGKAHVWMGNYEVTEVCPNSPFDLYSHCDRRACRSLWRRRSGQGICTST